ncbi:unnamed protein product [Vitrella brassicaformis CCMP3155]|uniref:Uncharacterized protein n=2 Tax=Vitrella brassicaformis TaxID=1169539 RepID=A0A0G4GWU4_VITBC|nr:unnamed protein product [Vitrella brassicaformis CCMP3155]|eukprot:CEM35320.1 unnamed protein product [Vitrella brassicaformis CCMP3155]
MLSVKLTTSGHGGRAPEDDDIADSLRSLVAEFTGVYDGGVSCEKVDDISHEIQCCDNQTTEDFFNRFSAFQRFCTDHDRNLFLVRGCTIAGVKLMPTRDPGARPFNLVPVDHTLLTEKTIRGSTSFIFRSLLRVMHIYRDSPTDSRVYLSGVDFILERVWDPLRLFKEGDKEKLFEVSIVRTQGSRAGRTGLAVVTVEPADEIETPMTAIKTASMCVYDQANNQVLMLKRHNTDVGADLAWRIKAFWEARPGERSSCDRLLSRIDVTKLSDEELHLLCNFDQYTCFRVFFGAFMFRGSRTPQHIHSDVLKEAAFMQLIVHFRLEHERRQAEGIRVDHDTWCLMGGSPRTNFSPVTGEWVLETPLERACTSVRDEIGVHCGYWCDMSSVHLMRCQSPAANGPESDTHSEASAGSTRDTPTHTIPIDDGGVAYVDALRHDGKFKHRIYVCFVSEENMAAGMEDPKRLRLKNESERCYARWIPLEKLSTCLRRGAEYNLAEWIKDLCMTSSPIHSRQPLLIRGNIPLKDKNHPSLNTRRDRDRDLNSSSSSSTDNRRGNNNRSNQNGITIRPSNTTPLDTIDNWRSGGDNQQQQQQYVPRKSNSMGVGVGVGDGPLLGPGREERGGERGNNMRNMGNRTNDGRSGGSGGSNRAPRGRADQSDNWRA